MRIRSSARLPLAAVSAISHWFAVKWVSSIANSCWGGRHMSAVRHSLGVECSFILQRSSCQSRIGVLQRRCCSFRTIGRLRGIVCRLDAQFGIGSRPGRRVAPKGFPVVVGCGGGCVLVCSRRCRRSINAGALMLPWTDLHRLFCRTRDERRGIDEESRAVGQ